MYTYDTVTQAVMDLERRGYRFSFALRHDCIYCEDSQVRLSPDQFNIDEVYRFEGSTDPADETIIYAVSATDGSLKGTLVNAYGVYSDTATAELVSKLIVNSRKN